MYMFVCSAYIYCVYVIVCVLMSVYACLFMCPCVLSVWLLACVDVCVNEIEYKHFHYGIWYASQDKNSVYCRLADAVD